MALNKISNPVLLKIVIDEKVILCAGSMRQVCDRFAVEYQPTVRLLKKKLADKFSATVDKLLVTDYKNLSRRVSDDKGRTIVEL